MVFKNLNGQRVSNKTRVSCVNTAVSKECANLNKRKVCFIIFVGI